MTTAQLIALELVASLLATSSWLAAAVLIGRESLTRRAALLILSLMAVACAALIAGSLLVVALWQGGGWWFVQEKVLLAVPLAVVGTTVGIVAGAPPLLTRARGRDIPIRPGVRTAFAFAALAALGGLAAKFLVGYPVTPIPAVALLLAVAIGTWLAHAVFAQQGRRLVVGLSALAALWLVASVGLSWLTSVASPSALANAHPHSPGAPPASAVNSVSVEDLAMPDDAEGDIHSFDLTAAQEELTLSSGLEVSAWTFGPAPGPELRVQQGEIVEVTLHNRDIAEGVTIHWHGYDVPNAMDGVAGVTQDAVLPGDSFTYRFLADQPGTYWYHTHQNSADGVRRGLYGALIVEPTTPIAESVDVVLPVHTFGRSVLFGESDRPVTTAVDAGETVRVRLVNTDQEPLRFRITGATFEVVAVDGTDIAGPTAVDGSALRIPAGGRMDVAFTVPAGGVLVTTDSSSKVNLLVAPDGVDGSELIPDRSAGDLDLLSYGSRVLQPFPEGASVIRSTMVLDRLPRFLSGTPVQGYTVNGDVFPHIPSIEVDEGDVVFLTVANRGWETHPMHIHGHHVLVLSRNGVPSTGAPLWLDTFDVQPGEVWEVELVADNPGIWMDHCHNLAHAAEGMMMALHYAGVTSPFDQGGTHGNRPE